jgi:hypothetical protein
MYISTSGSDYSFPEKFFMAMGDTFGAIEREIDIIDLDENNAFVEHLKYHGNLKRVA